MQYLKKKTVILKDLVSFAVQIDFLEHTFLKKIYILSVLELKKIWKLDFQESYQKHCFQ